MIYTLKNERLTVSINSVGAELISARSSLGEEYIWQADKSFWGRHAPLLFPVCGRLLNSKYTYDGKTYEMGSHGFARDMEFSVKENSERMISFVLTSNENTASVYPFNFELSVIYTLSEERLTMDVSVRNNDEKVMPYMLGWHPGFTISGKIDDYSIAFPGQTVIQRHPMKPTLFVEQDTVDFTLDSGIFLPTEEEIYSQDTIIFANVGSEVVLLRDGEPRLVMNQSENLPCFAIWKAPHTEAEYICLEPWTGIPGDGESPECFDTRKMSRLGSGEIENYRFSVKFPC